MEENHVVEDFWGGVCAVVSRRGGAALRGDARLSCGSPWLEIHLAGIVVTNPQEVLCIGISPDLMNLVTSGA